MIFDFLKNMSCVLREEDADYQYILDSWKHKDYHVALMPAVFWYGGTFNLFDKYARFKGRNMIWIIPAGQNDYCWLPELKQAFVDFYENDEFDLNDRSYFPRIAAEEFEECILLHSNDLQDDPEHTILGANVLLIRLSLTSGRETILFMILDHQNNCWKNIIERHKISLTWFVDSGRGTEDYYIRVELYQLMKYTPFPELLPSLYFKGLYNKGEMPEDFHYLYSMISHIDADGYDEWRSFSGVYETGWK